MFHQLSPLRHLWWFRKWFIYLPVLHIHTASGERPRLSGCVLLVILMDSEPFSRAFSPPTSMWWWSSILLRQQILLSTDPFLCTQAAFYVHIMCTFNIKKRPVCECVFCSLAVSWRYFSYCDVVLSLNQKAVEYIKRPLAAFNLVQVNYSPVIFIS